MKKSHLLAVLAATFLTIALATSRAPAQATTGYRPAPAAPTIGLLDVSYIFKNHPRFKANMTEMQNDLRQAETNFKAERDEIQRLAQQLKQFEGTRDQKALEEDLVRRQTNLAAQIQLQKKEFYQREAKIYHNAYQEILQVVAYYCQTNNISMVLRFDGDPVKVENPEDVLRFINRPVVFHQRQQDITQVVLQGLNRDQNRAGTPGVGTTDTRSRPGVYVQPR